jgi:glycosyltransferase involved in cell wall biosynthesis
MEQKELISILVPTRNRPKNVLRLIESAISTAKMSDKIEFIFYIDEDDQSMDMNLESSKVKFVRGPRIWVSLALNILYSHCNGEIIMYGADDIVFKSKYWDQKVRNTFNKYDDKICLVYANDGIDQSQEIARHGFIHRRWFAVCGSAFPSLRGFPTDLWCTDIAKLLNRLIYLKDVTIEHVHFRQGKKAMLDQTYIDAIKSAKSWNSKKTYKKLEYEMRNDRILLGEVLNPRLKPEKKYYIGELVSKNTYLVNYFGLDTRKLKSLKNHQIFSGFLKFIINKLRRKII